jgi:hypothetical protein
MALPILVLGTVSPYESDGERQHDGGAEALRGARRDQQGERGRGAAQE